MNIQLISILTPVTKHRTGGNKDWPYSNLLHRVDAGNTGKAFGEQAWNIHLRFCQMLCPYVSSPKSAAMPKSGHCGIND
jgi:hypothetical protein